MGCADCEKMDDDGLVAFIRIGRASVGLIGCDAHLDEVVLKLREIRGDSPREWVRVRTKEAMATDDMAKDLR